MGLRIYNTVTRSLEPFEPLAPPLVRMYGCGPTVYDHAHIGNFRAFVFYDLVHRYLAASGHAVRFVMNLTDVDDRTIAAAAARNVPLAAHTEPFVRAFLEDSEALGIEPADAYPRATAYIPQMIAFVERLHERGLAYVADDGSVYFAISRFPGYGKLSRIDPDTVRPGARVAVDHYDKEDVRDFALWKAVKPQDVEAGAAWSSPWGLGRPGWHLECSVMSLTELGDTLDLHLGGEDLIFPHHEDEIAQSEGATGKPFVRYWLHVKHLIVNDQKMSKSLGNVLTVRDLLERGIEPAAIRHQLLSAHYRRELNFTLEGLDASTRAIQRLLDFQQRLERLDPAASAPASGVGRAAHQALTDFRNALDNDLNTAEAFAALFVFVAEANAALDRAQGSTTQEERTAALEALSWMDRVLGLLAVARRSRDVDAATRDWLLERIEQRARARQQRDFKTADSIRDELAQRGFVLEDHAGGTRWKRVGGPEREQATDTSRR
ncbi:MAG: cysteine--tRNA ligase [Gemmatimonadetes bacterium]|nr:cysteine--tRNA ligase [Gemmatimonadota bacterium]